jgi:hypothetical protein
MDNAHEILASERLRRHCRYSTFLGIGVWWTLFFALSPWDSTWATTMFLLFVPLVLFRLSFPMLVPPSPVRNRLAWYAVSYFQLPAAVCLAASFWVERGNTAGLLTLPWLGFTLFLASLGLDRLMNLKRGSHAEWGSIAATLLLPVGSISSYLYRAGENPLGFPDVIILLTAIHFHYTGFVLPILGGQLVKVRNDRLSRWLLFGIVGAIPLLAVGITVSHRGGPREVEFFAAGLLATLGIVMGTVCVRMGLREGGLSGTLLSVSGLSLAVALSWSLVYAAGQYGLIDGLTIPRMVYLHGAVNALGFAFCGLLGWHLHYVKDSYRTSALVPAVIS